jgi:hypothetical protein
MAEDQLSQTGIPSLTRTAVLLTRTSDEIFSARIDIETDVSGISLRSLQSGLMDVEKDDRVIFNPMLPPMGSEQIDMENLGNMDLASLVSVTLERPIFTTVEEIRKTELSERQARQEVEALLDSTVPQEPDQDLGKKGSSESWYVELWNMESKDDQWVQKASVHAKLDKDQFPDAASTPLPKSLDKGHLEQWFPWIKEKPVCDALRYHIAVYGYVTIRS